MKLAHVIAFAVAAVALPGYAADDEKKDKKADDKLSADALVGTWKVTGGKKAGDAVGDMAKDGSYVITKETITIKAGDMEAFVMKYKLDADKSPAAIDMEITKSPGDSANGSKAAGIVKLEKGELTLCYPPMGGDRPAKFDGEKFYLFTLKKQDAKKNSDK